MSDEWKIVQGLKRQAQNDSFGRNTYKETGEPRNYKPKEISELTEKELRDKMWAELDSDIIFDKSNEDRNIAQIGSYLQEMQIKGKVPNKFKIGEISINIDTKKPKRITFSSMGNIGKETMGLHQKYPYTVTIDENDIYSEVDIIDNYFRCGLTAVYEEEGKPYVPIRVSQKVSIINGEEISEGFDISSREKGIDIQPVVEGIVRNNPEYKIGNGSEIYREDIDPEEKIRKFQSERELISVREDLPTDLATIYETYDDYHKNYNFHIMGKTFDSYGEGIPVAKEIEEHCKYIYSLFIEAEKGIFEQSKADESEITNQDIIQNNTAESQESSTTNYDTDVESLSEEELDVLIEKMENLQREKQSKIERLQKIKRAQDLISLSKEQDKIIADLESQIEIEGVDFGEK